KVLFTDTADLASAIERRKSSDRIAERKKTKATKVAAHLETAWNDVAEQFQRMKEQVAASSPEATAQVMTELLDFQPDIVQRPLCLVGGRAYAAAWCQVRSVITRSANAEGQVTDHNPPLRKIDDRLIIVTDDGRLF